MLDETTPSSTGRVTDRVVAAAAALSDVDGSLQFDASTIKHVEAAGFAPAECIGYVIPLIRTTMTIYY